MTCPNCEPASADNGFNGYPCPAHMDWRSAMLEHEREPFGLTPRELVFIREGDEDDGPLDDGLPF